jgi:hypothetical protein
MRRLGMTVAMALAVALPLTAAAVTPASAGTRARVRITVKLIDRDGKAATPVDLQLLRLSSDTNVDLGTSTSRLVFPGRYNVAAWIPTGPPSSQSYTLGDEVIDLTHSRTITFDARRGKRVAFHLNVPSAVDELLEIAPVFDQHDWAFDPTTIAPPAGQTYVIPGRVPGMTLYAYSVWEKAGNTAANPSPFRYDVIHVSRGGVPAHPVYWVRQSSLTRVDVVVRATDPDQQAYLELSPMAQQGVPLNAESTLGSTPVHLTSYRTPGYEWQPIVDMVSPSGEIRDNDLDQAAYGKGHFREVYGSAVLAPNLNDIFADVEGRRLQAGQSQFPIQDPLHPTDEGTGLTQRLALYSGSRLLVSSHGGTLNATIPGASHWYELRLEATREAGATLSTRVSGVWRFPAHAVPISQGDLSPPIYEVRLLPGGLNDLNQAPQGATTPVALSIFGTVSPTSVHLPVVRGYASFNDGTTWSRVSVRADGGHYVLTVHDPHSAGFVSVRVYVRAAGGASEELTVIHAYGVK